VDKVNGKQLPNKIKANGIVFILDKDNKEYKREDGNAEEFYTDYMIDGFVDLTDEVEVIEDKKIEKIMQLCEYPNTDTYECWNIREEILVEKINEIIDKINGGTNE
jgi:hypothetical protein